MLVGFAWCVYAVWRSLPVRVPVWRRVWPLAGAIGVPRIIAVVVGALALRGSGPRQVLGELVLFGMPEIGLISAWRANPGRWLGLACVLLVASSFVWAALLLQIWRRGEPR